MGAEALRWYEQGRSALHAFRQAQAQNRLLSTVSALASSQAEDQLIMNVGPTFDAADSDVVANLADVADLKGGDGGNGTNGGGPQALEREFMLAMEIADRSPVVGKTVDGAGLRCLPSAFLVALERATGQHINAVGPDEVRAMGQHINTVEEARNDSLPYVAVPCVNESDQKHAPCQNITKDYRRRKRKE